MVNDDGYPRALASRRRIRTQALWKVDTHMRSATGPTSAATRAFISSAALLVKVMARTSKGDTFPSEIRWAMRWVRTRVLPDPAPATTSSGPSPCVTASACSGFSPASSSWARRCSRSAVASALDIAGSRYRQGLTPSGDLGDTGGVTTTDPTGTVDPNVLLVEAMMTPEGRADPYPRYRALHEHAPVFESVIDALVLVRYKDCWEVLPDNRLGKSDGGERDMVRMTPYQQEQMAKRNPRASSMLFLNPPDHTRLRGLVSKAFTPRTVERMRPHILRLTDGFLDGFDGEVDVISSLAFPLPVTVIGEMLGVPESDRPGFQPMVRAATKALEFSMSEEEFDAALEALDAMNEYFADLVAARRKDPQDDLLSSLIAARDEGDRLTEEEIISTAILLFAAGFETTTNLIGNGLLALLRHPDQLRRLRDEPGLIKSAVEEVLRWDSPVQIDGRSAFEDVEVAGQPVAKDTFVVTLLGAANHDPTHYTAPERFDIGRNEGPPMSFASGIHYCLGAALARLEGQVVFGRVIERYPPLELLDEAPHYKDNFVLRGLSELRVEARGA